MRSERPIVYTAIFGHKDDLKDPLHPSKACDYVCFTNRRDFESQIFDIEICDPFDIRPVMAAKWYKMNPHLLFPDGISLWIDGSVLVKSSDIVDFIERHSRESHFTLFADSTHQSVRSLMNELKLCKPDIDPKTLEAQYQRYRDSGFPDTVPVVKGGVLLRNHHVDDVMRFDTEWWLEIISGTSRDEVSFPYVAWKSNVEFAYFPYQGIYNNPHFAIQKHNDKKVNV